MGDRGEMVKRCCSKGCENIKRGDEGYQVSFGFMLWACPLHAEEWKLFDEARHNHTDKMASAYLNALSDFEEAWDKEYERRNPAPIPPDYQSSEVW